LQFGGRRWDSGDTSFDDGQWKGGGQDVLSGNVSLRISSKDLVDKGVLGGCWKEVLLFVFTVLDFVEGNMGKGVKAVDESGGDRGTGDNVSRAVRGVEEGVILRVVKGGPDRNRGWGILEFGGLRGDGLEDAGGDIERTWVIPSVVRALKDLKDGGSGVRNVLLIDVVKGGPRSDRDVGKGRGGDDGGLGRVERHSILN